MANRERSEWVYDELLCFLGNPFFQIPVITFMEANCLIFDPSEDDTEEYKKIFTDYKQLVAALLEGFMKDSGLSHEAVIKALGDMNARSDLREIFQGLFEQVLAMDDYPVFVRLMTQKNIELQQQALLLLVQTTGSIPESLQQEDPHAVPSKKRSPRMQGKHSPREKEDEVMKAVLEQSRKEYESSRKEEKKHIVKEKQFLQELVISPNEVHRLEEEKKKEQRKLDEALLGLNLDPMPVKMSMSPPPVTEQDVFRTKLSSKNSHAKPGVKTSKSAVLSEKTKKSVTLTEKNALPPTFLSTNLSEAPTLTVTPVSSSSPVSSSENKVSASEAAANWLKSAQSEVGSSEKHSQAVSAAAAALSKLNPEELRKRQEFLKQQRDKLIEMKKKEREKQLLAAEKSQPQRPMSARAAKSMLNSAKEQESQKQSEPVMLSPEEKKKLEMRRAIADRLKAELLVPK